MPITESEAISAINTLLTYIADDEIESRGLSDREKAVIVARLEDMRTDAMEQLPEAAPTAYRYFYGTEWLRRTNGAEHADYWTTRPGEWREDWNPAKEIEEIQPEITEARARELFPAAFEEAK